MMNWGNAVAQDPDEGEKDPDEGKHAKEVRRELTGRSRMGRRSIHESHHPESTAVDHCARCAAARLFGGAADR